MGSNDITAHRIGVHTSIAGGIVKSLDRAAALGCDTLQIFSHNPRGWAVAGKSLEEAGIFRRTRERYGVAPLFIHSSYLINLATAKGLLIEKSIAMVVEELNIADALDAEYVVIHTGSALGDDPEEARERAARALLEVSRRGKWGAGILLENTAGERGDITSGIKEIAEIMERIPNDIIAGLCLDTCHAFSAGYDVREGEGLASLQAEIELYMGREKVRLIHLNDSKGGLGSHIDRHEHIGKGRIGLRGFENFLDSPFFAGIPLILETPKKTEEDDPMNLRIVKDIIDKRRRLRPK